MIHEVSLLITNSPSLTIIDVMSSLACDHTVYCQAKSSSQIISMFALMNYEKNFRAEVQVSPGQFYLGSFKLIFLRKICVERNVPLECL